MDSFLLPLLWLIISLGWSIYACRRWKTQFLIMPLIHYNWNALQKIVVYASVFISYKLSLSTSLYFALFFLFWEVMLFSSEIWRKSLFQVLSEGPNVHPLLTITSWNSYNLLLSHSVFTQMVEVTSKYQNKFKFVQDH